MQNLHNKAAVDVKSSRQIKQNASNVINISVGWCVDQLDNTNNGHLLSKSNVSNFRPFDKHTESESNG